MAERYQPGEYFAKFMEQLPQVMMQQQYLVLARERHEEQKANKVAQNLRDEQYLVLARERHAEQKTNKEFSKNMQYWNGIMSFAGQLPMGQKYAFISKQSENLPEEFMIESGLGNRMEEFKVLEEQSVDRTLMFENLEQEDSTEKIQTALDLNLVIEPVRRKALRSRINEIEKRYGDQKPFNSAYLEDNELISYNQIKGLLEEETKTNLSLELEKSKTGTLTDAKERQYQVSSDNIIELNKQLQPYLVAGAPKKIPEFISSSESLSALNENPDLRSSFFADDSNDLDAFVQARIYDPQAEAIRAKAYELEGVTTQEEYEKKMGMDEFTLEEVPIGAQYGPQGPPPPPPPAPPPPAEGGISDRDLGDLRALGKGIAIGGGGYAAVKGAPKVIEYGKKVAAATVKAGKYIHKLTKLSPSQITEFLESDLVEGTLGKLNKYEKAIKKGQNTKQVQKLINITKDKSIKYWSKRFGVKPDVIAKLYKTGTTGRWNLWRAKAGVPKAFRKYAVGSIITDALGFEMEGIPRAGIDITTGFAAEKAVTKKFLPQLVKIVASDKGKKYLAKVVGKAAAKKIVTSTATGSMVPGWGNLVMAFVGTGLAANDIYNLVKDWDEEEE